MAANPEIELDNSYELHLETPYTVSTPDLNHVVSMAVPPELVDPGTKADRAETAKYATGDTEIDRKLEILRLTSARTRMDGIQAFVEDPDQAYWINQGRGPGAENVRMQAPSDEELEGLIAIGAGTQGIHTVIEPADLDLYRSFIPAPLAMPEHPIVGASLLDMNQTGLKLNRFQEGRFTIKVLCPDGLESWLCLSTPVPFLHHTREGVIWGWPKYVADQISFTRGEDTARAEVLYQGEERYSLDFTAGPVEDEKYLKSFGKIEGGNTVTWHWIQGGAVCTRQGRGPGIDTGAKPPTILDWQGGQVKVHVKQSDPWAGLIPEDSVTDGWYQKWIGGGGGDAYWVKLATVGGLPV
jgi:hypothetical protein